MGRFGGTYLTRAAQSVFAILMLYMMLPTIVFAEQSEEEKNFLLMYFKEEELQVVSSTRSIKSISRVAENMTVVTAQDIERMNAHTLADVLKTVNGVQVWFSGGSPGNLAQLSIQGSENRQALVMIDGVVLNNLPDSVVDAGIIPVQNIEKIEIVKGPASSVWGSALGGVINIITKSPPDNGVHGTISGSLGTKSTDDFRAEASGKIRDAGFYLSAGRLHSNGLRPFTNVTNNNLYSKLTYDISADTSIAYTLSYTGAKRGDGDFSDFDEIDKDRVENYFSTLSLNSRLLKGLDLNVSVNAQRQRRVFTRDVLSTGEEILPPAVNDDRRYGGNAKLVWKTENNTIVVGSDYDNGTAKSDTLLDGEQHLRKLAFFANDTITFDKFAITPGIRYDHTSTNGDFVSPSIGATYQVTRKTILRATVARGFNTPPLGYTYGSIPGYSTPNPDLKPEKVWSYQIGVESGELEYIWVKVSLFRHDIRDVFDPERLADGSSTYVNAKKQRRQGFEADMRTIPVYNTSLSAGVTFVDAKDIDSNTVRKQVPRYTYDVALTYDDKKTFRALLQGHYIWWNADDYSAYNLPEYNSKYSSFVFDLNMNKILYRHKDQTVEVFFTAHNLFNNNQYLYEVFRNAQRWYEGGLRYRF